MIVTTYPNPFLEYTTIEFENLSRKEFKLRVFNLRGQLVVSDDDIKSNQVRISRNDLTSGIYFFHLLSGNNIVGIGKLILE